MNTHTTLVVVTVHARRTDKAEPLVTIKSSIVIRCNPTGARQPSTITWYQKEDAFRLSNAQQLSICVLIYKNTHYVRHLLCGKMEVSMKSKEYKQAWHNGCRCRVCFNRRVTKKRPVNKTRSYLKKDLEKEIDINRCK